jgi:hypothetical protein
MRVVASIGAGLWIITRDALKASINNEASLQRVPKSKDQGLVSTGANPALRLATSPLVHAPSLWSSYLRDTFFV